VTDALTGPNRWDHLNQELIDCRRCPRLIEHCQQVASQKRRAYRQWDYWGKPVPNFGDSRARLLVVGLAPAAHGANRTGRMFTGDRSGDWLFRALQSAGFANRGESHARDDGLQLLDCAITAVCHCAPPANKPTRQELAECRCWLERTLSLLPVQVLVALGQIAWNVTLAQLVARQWYAGRRPKFAHGKQVPLAGQRWLIGSYHPSQQNTFTGRLTEPMLQEVFLAARGVMSQRPGRAD
jgi:uracil-DNA glycosylase family 4